MLDLFKKGRWHFGQWCIILRLASLAFAPPPPSPVAVPPPPATPPPGVLGPPLPLERPLLTLGRTFLVDLIGRAPLMSLSLRWRLWSEVVTWFSGVCVECGIESEYEFMRS